MSLAQRKLNLGIIGLGRIGKLHLRSIQESLSRAHCAAVADPDQAALKVAVEVYGILECHRDWKDLVHSANVDAVVICSPHSYHAEQIIECIEMGKAVFCEKPLTPDLEGGRRLVEIVGERNAFCMVGFQRRFDADWLRLKAAVQSGEIGEVESVRLVARDTPSPAAYSQTSGAVGIHMDMMIHDLEMCRFLVGADVDQVFALGRSIDGGGESEEADLYRTSVVSLRFGNGVLGSVECSRLSSFGHDQRAEIFGSAGMVRLENQAAQNLLIVSWFTVYQQFQRPCSITTESAVGETKDAIQLSFQSRYASAYLQEMREFVDCVLNGKPPPVTVVDAHKAAAVAHAARESMLTNLPVRVQF